jgi:hypothetical protein
MTKDAFIRLVIEWNQSSTHENNIIQDMVWNGERNIRYGSNGLWLDIEEYRNQNIIAVRYEKKEDDGSVWDTDYVMNFNSMKMAVRLDRSYTEDALNADPKFSTPHFITLLIEQGYIKKDGALPVLREPIVIDKENLELITDIYTRLKEESRRSDSKANYMTVPAAMKELEKIELIKMPDGNYSLNYAITATQKAILKAFDIDAANIRKQAKNISTELVAKEA